jgi:N-acetylneuraminic acid mutarotase
MRRRIVAGVVVLAVIVVPVYHLSGHGKSSKVGTGRTTTTSTPASTTTVPPQLVVADTSWHAPVPLSRSVVLAINTNLGVFGGLTTTATSKTVYEIDPATGIATNLGAMPTPVHDAAGAVIGGDFYVFGGGSATETAAVQRFTFTDSTHLTGSVVGNLPAKRADLATATFNGQVYLAGGFDGKKWLPDVLSTTDGMSLNPIANLATPVRYPAVAAVNGKLYVIGGELSPNQADATNVEEIDLQTDTVTALSPLSKGLSHAAAVVLNGVIYVFGGRSGGHAVATISVFNPATGQLQPVGSLPGGLGRSDMGVGLVGGIAYLVGGEGDNGKPITTVVTARLVAG